MKVTVYGGSTIENDPVKKRCISCQSVSSPVSHQGERQWVILEFPQSVKVSELRIQFQGGFSAGTCRLEGKRLHPSPQMCISDRLLHLFQSLLCQIYVVFHFFPAGCQKEGDFNAMGQFYPEDNNCLQSFPIQEAPLTDKVKIMFENSADFFGRIIVYALDILGEKAS
uniref:Nuclear receptor 2C2-associated protein n=1 Tax=Takifugu rubripes TaxID=31033 RepID=A0A3B5KV06_TAKRU